MWAIWALGPLRLRPVRIHDPNDYLSLIPQFPIIAVVTSFTASFVILNDVVAMVVCGFVATLIVAAAVFRVLVEIPHGDAGVLGFCSNGSESKPAPEPAPQVCHTLQVSRYFVVPGRVEQLIHFPHAFTCRPIQISKN
jgi:hypothetical protein